MSSRAGRYAMATGTVLLWGASFPVTKALLQWTGPTTIAFLRWAISGLALLILVAARGRTREAIALVGDEGGSVLWVALTGITLFYFLENLALRYTSAINAGVLANLTSVFMVLIGAFVLRERLTPVQWAALAVAFVGALLVSGGGGNLRFGDESLKGDLLMAVAGLLGALYSIGGKRLSVNRSPTVVTAVVGATGALLLLPLALWEGGPWRLPLVAWAMLLLLGLGAGALANVWWISLLSQTPASRAALALFLIPVVSTVMAVLFLGERLSAGAVVGAGLILAGVWIMERSAPGSRQELTATAEG